MVDAGTQLLYYTYMKQKPIPAIQNIVKEMSGLVALTHYFNLLGRLGVRKPQIILAGLSMTPIVVLDTQTPKK